METLKKIWSWIRDKVSRFNDWLASIAPGLKTKTITVIGIIGSSAATLQEYVTGLPVTTFISAEKMAIVTMVLFTLAFWFRMLTKKED